MVISVDAALSGIGDISDILRGNEFLEIDGMLSDFELSGMGLALGCLDGQVVGTGVERDGAEVVRVALGLRVVDGLGKD